MASPLDQYSPIQSAIALLQPTVSYAQKRADADRNLLYQSGLTEMSRQQQEQAKQQALLAQQAQAQLMSVPFLERDQARWRDLIDGLKGKVRKRVESDFGGDYEQYARSGMLDQDIQNLSLDAQRNPLFPAALQRRQNYVDAQKDAQDGKIGRSVQYKLLNGQTKVAPFDQAYIDFDNGLTEELPYRGGFKVDGKWRKVISENYSPRLNKLGKYVQDQARPEEIVSAMVSGEGLTGEDALDYYRRTAALLPPITYKVEPPDKYREEQLRLGWANYGLGKERNKIARDRNAITKQAAGGSQIDLYDFFFNKPGNVITRTKDGQPGYVPASIYDGNMKAAGTINLTGVNGQVYGKQFLESTGAVLDKKTGAYRGAGGQAYVTVKNQAGGVDLRATDLSGLSYETRPGNIYVYQDKPNALEQQTGQKPVRYLQEQTIVVSSDEAKKAGAGKLFRDSLGGSGQNPGGWLGNSDTPTGKGAYRKVERGGKTYYEFKVLQPVNPTAFDRQKPTWEMMNTQGKAGQAVMNDANDDLLDYTP